MSAVEFICLANSAKLGEHCVAGIRTDGQGWIRPIGARHDGALTSMEAACEDGRMPRILDVLRVDLEAPVPRCHQPENWRCSSRPHCTWRRVRQANSSDIRVLMTRVQRGPHLLGDAGKSLAYGDLEARPASASLALVEPQSLRWEAKRWSSDEPLRAEADLVLAGHRYWLKVTDPAWKGRIIALEEGLHTSQDLGVNTDTHRVLLTISLSEPYSRHGEPPHCWKLVAGVVVVPK